MILKLFLAPAAAVALFASCQSGMALPVAPLQNAQSAAVQQVTFWGRSFPYGYNWSLARACTRYVPVDTGRGQVMRRVWVCGERSRGDRGVVSYRG